MGSWVPLKEKNREIFLIKRGKGKANPLSERGTGPSCEASTLTEKNPSTGSLLACKKKRKPRRPVEGGIEGRGKA